MNFKRTLIPTLGGAIYADPGEICFLEAKRHYTLMIMKNNEKHEITLSLRQIHERLDSNNFIRTHRSYVVNVNHICRVKGAFELLKLATKDEIPVSRQRRPEVRKVLNGLE
mgnify:CR=1 FL=1